VRDGTSAERHGRQPRRRNPADVTMSRRDE
jgi:hypothetical protein